MALISSSLGLRSLARASDDVTEKNSHLSQFPNLKIRCRGAKILTKVAYVYLCVLDSRDERAVALSAPVDGRVHRAGDQGGDRRGGAHAMGGDLRAARLGLPQLPTAARPDERVARERHPEGKRRTRDGHDQSEEPLVPQASVCARVLRRVGDARGRALHLCAKQSGGDGAGGGRRVRLHRPLRHLFLPVAPSAQGETRRVLHLLHLRGPRILGQQPGKASIFFKSILPLSKMKLISLNAQEKLVSIFFMNYHKLNFFSCTF